MYGWEEMVSNVSKFYHSLPDSERERCNLWGGSYGHAGALLYYAHKYDLPKDVTSFNGSFTLWAKDEADFDAQIMVDDRWSSESEYWLNIELIDSTDNPYARDRGYIFYRTDPKVNIPDTWRSLVKEAKTAYSR